MSLLPSEFSDLERFASKWCKVTEDERWAQRLASSMEEIQAFYDALKPRAQAAVRYCDQHELDALTQEAKRLLQLLCALAEVSFAVECWGQTRVPDTGAAHVSCILQPTL